MKFNLYALFICAISSTVFAKLKDGECEVCIAVVNKFIGAAKEAKAETPTAINEIIRKTCKSLVQRENRFVSMKNFSNFIFFLSVGPDRDLLFFIFSATTSAVLKTLLRQ